MEANLTFQIKRRERGGADGGREGEREREMKYLADENRGYVMKGQEGE